MDNNGNPNAGIKIQTKVASNPNMDLFEKEVVSEAAKNVADSVESMKNPRGTKIFGSNLNIQVKTSRQSRSFENLQPSRQVASDIKDTISSEQQRRESSQSNNLEHEAELKSKKTLKERTVDFFGLKSKDKHTDTSDSESIPDEKSSSIPKENAPSKRKAILMQRSDQSFPSEDEAALKSVKPPSDQVEKTRRTIVPGANYRASKLPLSNDGSSSAFQDITGYKSAKSPERNEADNTKGAVTSPQHSVMAGLRQSRMSSMLGSGGSKDTLSKDRDSPNQLTLEGNAAASVATYSTLGNLRQSKMLGMLGMTPDGRSNSGKTNMSAKNFKEFYRNLLKVHDHQEKLNMGVSKRTKQFKISTMFGLRNEPIDPMDRMMWMSSYFTSLKTDSAWIAKPTAIAPGTASDKSEARVLDINIDVDPEGIEIDSFKTEGLDMVVSGTLESLLDGLIVPVSQDLSYPEVFLASYRFFVSPLEVFHCLTRWYNVTDEGSTFPDAESEIRFFKRSVQQRCLRIILLWIRNHWQDFLDNQSLWSLLRSFTKELSSDSFLDYQKIMHAIREERLNWMTSQYIPMFPGIKATDTGEMWSAELDTIKFAHDLTMLDHTIFRQMKPDLYLQVLSNPGNLYSGAYNIPLKGLFDYCNWFRMVVAYPPSILAIQENTKKRTMSIRLFIKIAKSCLDLGNFHGAFAICFGLKQPASLIWHSAWENVPAKYVDIFQEINALMDFSDGYKNYWEAISQAKPPAVPYLVPYLHDLVYLNDNTLAELASSPSTGVPGKNVINFEKFYDMFSIAAELETFRLSSFSNILDSNKNSAGTLLQHIRFISKQDDVSLGAGTNFTEGILPDENPVMNSESAMKNIKKIINIMAAGSSEHP